MDDYEEACAIEMLSPETSATPLGLLPGYAQRRGRSVTADRTVRTLLPRRRQWEASGTAGVHDARLRRDLRAESAWRMS